MSNKTWLNAQAVIRRMDDASLDDILCALHQAERNAWNARLYRRPSDRDDVQVDALRDELKLRGATLTMVVSGRVSLTNVTNRDEVLAFDRAKFLCTGERW